MTEIKVIVFWVYPHPKLIQETKIKYHNAKWVDLDVDFAYPKTNILPEAYCKIIRNIIDNTIYLKPDLILAPIGKDKCDSGWFASIILKDMVFNVIPSIFEETDYKKEIVICKSNLPLIDKITRITANIVSDEYKGFTYIHSEVPPKEENPFSNKNFTPGFWGVPPKYLEILK